MEKSSGTARLFRCFSCKPIAFADVYRTLFKRFILKFLSRSIKIVDSPGKLRYNCIVKIPMFCVFVPSGYTQTEMRNGSYEEGKAAGYRIPLREESNRRKIHVPRATASSRMTSSGRPGTSRTSIRPALLRLKYEGLVEMIPNRGAFVAKPNEEDLRQVYRVREVLECGMMGGRHPPPHRGPAAGHGEESQGSGGADPALLPAGVCDHEPRLPLAGGGGLRQSSTTRSISTSCTTRSTPT